MKKDYTIGIDIGGTKMAAVLFDGTRVLSDFVLATPKDNIEHFIIMILALIEPLIEQAKNDKRKIAGIGVGVAGVLNYEEGRVLGSPNIPIIDGLKLAAKLEERINLPIFLDNDANCFVRAEAELGVGKNNKNIYGMIIGTGIGGGWYVNNEVYRGPHGGAGEPGEMVINFDSGMRLEEAYHKLTQSNPASIAEEAYRGDMLSQKTFEEVGKYLGIAAANIVNILDPELIVIGGGVVESSDLFLSEAKKAMKEYIYSSESKKIKIVKGKMGKDAGAIGAALLVK